MRRSGHLAEQRPYAAGNRRHCSSNRELETPREAGLMSLGFEPVELKGSGLLEKPCIHFAFGHGAIWVAVVF